MQSRKRKRSLAVAARRYRGWCSHASILFLSFYYVYIIFQGGAYMSNEELRAMYKERLKREKQYYIAEATGIDKAILSRFKNNKINSYFFRHRLQ